MQIAMSRRTNRLAFLLLTVALALASCNRKAVYSHYEHTSLDGWDSSDSLTYDIAPIPTDGYYEESVGLRIGSDYPFMGLTLIIEQHIYPTGIHHIDTLHASLIDHDGTIQGQGISYFQYDFLLRQLRLNANDSLHLCIHHNMKREMLPGISDVGITIRETE